MEELLLLRRARLRGDAVRGALLLAFTNLWFVHGPIDLILVLAIGALAGLLWALVGAGSIGVGLIAAAAQAVVCLGPLAGQPGFIFTLLFGSAFAALAGSYLGMRREERAFG
ncbi:hypothetical protein Pla86_30120 [Planctomycetes bacterium Pla86]|uniref:Uncharacterized protein n=2 Tax=Engelhardtia mirabilis TaxID=2528011 RepID=A0A518BLR9_9BACT|nr:hypothetical protein Pla133_30130 [Planctomycetes bacterium Pla133]QDV02250.1 hypothetical protein Pla86_30120 [Planctomycetes bacterium Pla86]